MMLPVAALAASPVHAFRLDEERFATTWDSGEGAFIGGGRWNSKGVRCVYCSLDSATAILEIAVHKGVRVLDTTTFKLTILSIGRPDDIHVVDASLIPNPNWLAPGAPGAGQQVFGDDLLAAHRFIALPSAVSRHSWNLIFDPAKAAGLYTATQEPFALDPRLHPPA